MNELVLGVNIGVVLVAEKALLAFLGVASFVTLLDEELLKAVKQRLHQTRLR